MVTSMSEDEVVASDVPPSYLFESVAAHAKAFDVKIKSRDSTRMCLSVPDLNVTIVQPRDTNSMGRTAFNAIVESNFVFKKLSYIRCVRP